MHRRPILAASALATVALMAAQARADHPRRDVCDHGEVPYCFIAAVMALVPSPSVVVTGETVHGGIVWELPVSSYDVRHIVAASVALYDDMAPPLVRAVYRFRPWPKEVLSGLPHRPGPDLSAGVGAWWHPDRVGPRLEIRGYLHVVHGTVAYELDVANMRHRAELRLGLEFPLPLL